MQQQCIIQVKLKQNTHPVAKVRVVYCTLPALSGHCSMYTECMCFQLRDVDHSSHLVCRHFHTLASTIIHLIHLKDSQGTLEGFRFDR
jgi:hypothetical protein